MTAGSVPIAFAAAVLVILSSACGERTPEGVTAAEAKEVADRYMTENLPQVPLDRWRTETVDMGKSWKVSYRLPEGGTGGFIMFLVDKRTGKIIGGKMDQ